jgi:hypothetical protein
LQIVLNNLNKNIEHNEGISAELMSHCKHTVFKNKEPLPTVTRKLQYFISIQCTHVSVKFQGKIINHSVYFEKIEFNAEY